MKKLLFLFAILCTGFRCEPDPPYNEGTWIVENMTGQIIIVTVPSFEVVQNPYHVEYFLENRTVLPGNRVFVETTRMSSEYMPEFEQMIEAWGDLIEEEDIFFEILSEDGESLKKWRYLDKDESNKQFFNESSWGIDRYDNADGEGYPHIGIDWHFSISPEDITQN